MIQPSCEKKLGYKTDNIPDDLIVKKKTRTFMTADEKGNVLLHPKKDQ